MLLFPFFFSLALVKFGAGFSFSFFFLARGIGASSLCVVGSGSVLCDGVQRFRLIVVI